MSQDKIDYNRLLQALYRKWRGDGHGKTEADFAQAIGISSRQYRNYKNDHKVSKNVISTVHRIFPDYEKIWHELNISSNLSQEPLVGYGTAQERVPFYDSALNTNNGINDWTLILEGKPTYLLDFPQLRGCDITIRYECDNMTGPRGTGIRKGAVLGLIEVDLEKDIFPYGLTYMIITQRFLFVYQIYESKDKNKWLCKNMNPEYSDIEIDIRKVKKVFAVKAYLNQNFN